MVPYHPLLLEALQQRVEVRIVLTAEYLKAEEIQYVGRIQDQIYANFAWTSGGLFRFLHEASLAEYEEPVSKSIIRIVSSPDQSRSFREAKEGDDECEDVFYNSKQESYVIVNGDLRKL